MYILKIVVSDVISEINYKLLPFARGKYYIEMSKLGGILIYYTF